MSNNFQVVFHGLASSGTTIDQLKTNIAKLYNTEVKNVESLFKGSAVVIKDNLDEATAHKYAEVFRKQGAQCELRDKSEAKPKEPTNVSNTDSDANQKSQAAELAQGDDSTDQSQAEQESSKVIETVAIQSSKPETNRPVAAQKSDALVSGVIAEEISERQSVTAQSTTNAGGITLAKKCTVVLDDYVGSMAEISVADTGSTIVEIKQVDTPDINTSHFEVAEAGETLIEFKEIAEPEISTDSFSLAAVGSDIKGGSD
ncbi:hypothetical protein MNBD_GAMMA12-1554 [hydrothermal vent metagenome]|uniref:Uncharacterized protein n=1 Tax=hydrothermal vent metagenome TaxID=652676 RepID=A0A3B0Y4N1_9ZZZZ